MKKNLENNQENKRIKKEKNTDLLGLFRNFLKAGKEELSQEEEMNVVTDDEKLKKELEKSLKRAQNIQESIFKESVRVKAVGGLEASKNIDSTKKRVIKKEHDEELSR